VAIEVMKKSLLARVAENSPKFKTVMEELSSKEKFGTPEVIWC